MTVNQIGVLPSDVYPLIFSFTPESYRKFLLINKDMYQLIHTKTNEKIVRLLFEFGLILPQELEKKSYEEITTILKENKNIQYITTLECPPKLLKLIGGPIKFAYLPILIPPIESLNEFKEHPLLQIFEYPISEKVRIEFTHKPKIMKFKTYAQPDQGKTENWIIPHSFLLMNLQTKIKQVSFDVFRSSKEEYEVRYNESMKICESEELYADQILMIYQGIYPEVIEMSKQGIKHTDEEINKILECIKKWRVTEKSSLEMNRYRVKNKILEEYKYSENNELYVEEDKERELVFKEVSEFLKSEQENVDKV